MYPLKDVYTDRWYVTVLCHFLLFPRFILRRLRFCLFTLPFSSPGSESKMTGCYLMSSFPPPSTRFLVPIMQFPGEWTFIAIIGYWDNFQITHYRFFFKYYSRSISLVHLFNLCNLYAPIPFILHYLNL